MTSLPLLHNRIDRITPLVLVLAGALACADSGVSPVRPEPAISLASASPTPGVINYDSRDLTEYLSKWSNIYGPLEMAAGGTRRRRMASSR